MCVMSAPVLTYSRGKKTTKKKQDDGARKIRAARSAAVYLVGPRKDNLQKSPGSVPHASWSLFAFRTTEGCSIIFLFRVNQSCFGSTQRAH